MSAAVIGLTLFAAALHATWNAALRSGVDRLCFVTIMSFATTLAAIPFALLLPLPATQSWTYLGISAVLQVLYSIFLAHAYRYGELGQVYPIVRGSVPLMVTIGGFVLDPQGRNYRGRAHPWDSEGDGRRLHFVPELRRDHRRARPG